MSFDALTLSAVRDEIAPRITDGRLQKVVFPDESSLAIELFTPGVGRLNVLLSAQPENARVQRIEALPARGIERDTPFVLVARKHLRNARLHAVRQPRLERVLELDCEQRDESGQQYRVLLIVEVMGRRSNLVLVGEDGTILDAVRRSPPSRNPRRPILPHLRYTPPPPQDRLLPEQLGTGELALAARGRASTLASFLGERVAGLSPQAARELAFRATGVPDAPLTDVDWDAVVLVAREFLEPSRWEPTVAFRDDAVLAYAPYRLTHLAASGARLESFASISAAMQAFYTQARAPRGDPLAAERKALLAPLERAAASLERRVASLEYQLTSGREQQEPLRSAGELILTHQAAIPFGSTELRIDGASIALDPALTAVENAQAYFARYKKAREAAERVPALLESARHESEHVANLRALVEVADQMDAIRALRREVNAVTGVRAPTKTTAASSAPFRRLTLNPDWEVLVGTSAAGNASVTFDLAAPHDLWLHARGVPGAHVILRGRQATEPPNEILERAAALAAWHSAARTATSVEVDVTPRRYVRKIPNGPPGLVRYSNERTVRVSPKAP